VNPALAVFLTLLASAGIGVFVARFIAVGQGPTVPPRSTTTRLTACTYAGSPHFFDRSGNGWACVRCGQRLQGGGSVYDQELDAATDFGKWDRELRP